MSSYFTYTNLTANTLAKSADVNARFLAVQTGFDMLPDPTALQQARWNYVTPGGTANALTITLTPAPLSLVDGLSVRIKVVATNTGPATVNVNGLGAVAITKIDGTALSASDLPSGQIIDLVYDGTQFRVMRPQGVDGSVTPASLLANILTVDGTGSGLDADLVRGVTPGATGLTLLATASAAAARTALGITGSGADTTYAFRANNLSDLASAPTARTNLGLAAIAATASATDLTAGTVPAARMPAYTGDATSSIGTTALTLATVNSNTGTFGSATQSLTLTLDGKGRVTAASAQTVTPSILSVTGLGTGVQTALQFNVGQAGCFVVNGGALGTPSSGTATNITGLPISTGVSGLGTGVATFLATPSSANLLAALTTSTGTGNNVFSASPALTGNVSFGGATSPAYPIDSTGSLRLRHTSVIGSGAAGQSLFFSDATPTNIAEVRSYDFDGTNYGLKLRGWNGSALADIASFKGDGSTSFAGAITVSGTTSLSSAMTYGGVTLSNSVTGTGSMVLSASPTLTGTAAVGALTASGTITASGGVSVTSGNINLGSGQAVLTASGDLYMRAAGTLRLGGTGVNDIVLVTSTGLTVTGAATANGNLTSTGSDQSSSRVIVTNTGASGHSFAHVAGNYNVDQTGYTLVDLTAGLTRLRIDNAGAVTIGGAVATGALTVTGAISATAAVTAAAASGYYLGANVLAIASGGANGYHEFRSPTGVTNLHLGGSSDPNNYYNNTTHTFRNSTGATLYGTWGSTGLAVTGAISATVSIDSGGPVRGTGAASAFASGVGAELSYNGGTAYLLGYNRGTAAYVPLTVGGSTTTIQHGGADRITTNSTGVAVTGAITATTTIDATSHITTGGNIQLTSGLGTIYTGTGDVFIRGGAGGSLRMGANGANDLAILSSTGLAVTGGLSCTTGATLCSSSGTATYGGLEIGYRGMPSGSVSALTNGKCWIITAGQTLNTGFAADSIGAIYNNSGSAVTLTQGAGLTLRLHGTTTTGSRTLAARGLASILAISTTEYVAFGDVS